MVDLGANIGLYGALARTREPDASIVSFEPDPANLILLRACLQMNAALGEWQLVPACAAARDGAVRFSALGDPGSRVTDEPAAPGVVQVEARDVFPFLEGVDLLKVDIEGSEWELLADERFGVPSVVVLEYHPSGCPDGDPHVEARRGGPGALDRAALSQRAGGHAHRAGQAAEMRPAETVQHVEEEPLDLKKSIRGRQRTSRAAGKFFRSDNDLVAHDQVPEAAGLPSGARGSHVDRPRRSARSRR